MDTMEDSQHQGRPLLGLANETCNHCRVCLSAPRIVRITNLYFQPSGNATLDRLYVLGHGQSPEHKQVLRASWLVSAVDLLSFVDHTNNKI
jgi:hypothetical protein